jgi:hypothetical protein
VGWLGPGAVVAAPSWMEQRPHVLTKPVIKVVNDEHNKDDFETYSVTIVMTLFFPDVFYLECSTLFLLLSCAERTVVFATFHKFSHDNEILVI